MELLPRFELGTSSLPMVMMGSFFILYREKASNPAHFTFHFVAYHFCFIVLSYSFSSQIVVKPGMCNKIVSKGG